MTAAYAIGLGGFVKGGEPAEALFHFFADEEEAKSMVTELNDKYDTDESKLDWIEEYERTGHEISGHIEYGFSEFYVKIIDVIDHGEREGSKPTL